MLWKSEVGALASEDLDIEFTGDIQGVDQGATHVPCGLELSE